MNLTRAERIAKELLAEHVNRGGTADGRPWAFAWDNAKRRLGCCHYRDRKITLSRHLIAANDEGQMRDTMLHEIAHVLAPGDGHGARWKAACVRVGARPNRYARAEEVVMPPAPIELVCPECDARLPRYKRPRRSLVCRPCWEKHTRGQGPRPARFEVVDRRTVAPKVAPVPEVAAPVEVGRSPLPRGATQTGLFGA